MDLQSRAARGREIAIKAGALAMGYFDKLDSLEIEAKGHQDFVSQADREVELLIRGALGAAFPADGIVGEEHAPTPGTSGLTWVLDPIDGTSNFISGMPFWCVAIAAVVDGRTEIGIIHDPNHNETFTALRGAGAFLNGRAISVRQGATMGTGTVSVGSSRRSPPDRVALLLRSIIEAGGVFQRLGSGALGLAYTAAGRYTGYSESYMNAWDCLAGQLLIAEAGGLVEDQNADEMIAQGGRVVAGASGVFEELVTLTDAAFGKD